MALVPEQSNEVATKVAAPPALIERASELIRSHPECFWFRHPEAQIRHLEDIRLVVEHLREYGDRRAWWAAQELHKCLSPLSKRRGSQSASGALGALMGCRPHSQICQSMAATVRSFLAVTFRRWSSMSTSDSGGTLCMRKTFAPMVLPAPITVSPPTMVALA